MVPPEPRKSPPGSIDPALRLLIRSTPLLSSLQMLEELPNPEFMETHAWKFKKPNSVSPWAALRLSTIFIFRNVSSLSRQFGGESVRGVVSRCHPGEPRGCSETRLTVPLLFVVWTLFLLGLRLVLPVQKPREESEL